MSRSEIESVETDPVAVDPVAVDPVAIDVEQAVRERYSPASEVPEAALCCPVDYDTRFLEVLPAELIERDYGCGDPSRHLSSGETVLDLGSGGGKICYIASQVVGPSGKVIGVDRNDEMLSLARKFQPQIGQRIGHHNVEFHKGSIQDLALDLDRFEAYLRESPIRDANDWLRAEAHADQLRHSQPMIADDSVDVVVSNCVLNLVKQSDRQQLFSEIFRVLRSGGRAVISDIVCDERVPQELQNDPKLWSGCISGAYLEHEFLQAFEQAGFYGVEILKRQEEAWTVVEGIEFRSLTLRAYKGKQGPCMDHHQAVIYRGPWKSVTDDDGHTLRRGQRMAVCKKTFDIYRSVPYGDQIVAVEPQQPIAKRDASPFSCLKGSVRDPKETKGGINKITELPIADCYLPDGDCC